MVITQFIMGFIMGVYLMVIGTGHLTTKNVMSLSKGDASHQEVRQDNNKTNHFNSGQRTDDGWGHIL